MRRGRLPFPIHTAIELASASALLLVPFAIGLSFGATVTAAVIGSLLFGLAISGTASDGRGTLPLSAHAAFDSLLAFLLIAAAVAFGIAGDQLALALLLAIGALQLVLNSTTSYSLRSA